LRVARIGYTMVAANRRIGVVGLGYVGLTTASLLAYYGYHVVGVDIDLRKVEMLRRGRLAIYEPGLDEIYALSVGERRLTVSHDYGDLVGSEIIFITVGTPSLGDGSVDLSYVYSAARAIGEVLSRSRGGYPVIAIKSTVPPGTARRAAEIIGEASGLELGRDFGIVSNPEFLREGSAVEDTLRPSRVVIGEVDGEGASILEGFWREFYERVGYTPPMLRVKAETAEMIKYASNAFLATKISFANMIARICERIQNCDVVEVVRGMGLDPRINPHFLGAGLGYGGSCFPKDVKALIAIARKLSVDPSLLEAVDRINETQPLHVAGRLEEILGGLEGKTIAVLGAAFKPNTDDIRESRGVALAKILISRGARVKIHDPSSEALEKARAAIGEGAGYARDIAEALEGADAAVIATEWDIYRELDPSVFLKHMRTPIVFDARRIYSPRAFASTGVRYYAVGLG